MSKEKRKRILKVDPSGSIRSPKQHRSKPSLLNDSDYTFDSPTELSEFAKLYLGRSSVYDDTDPREEYEKIAKASKEKHSTPKSKSFLDDDYGEEFTVSDQISTLTSPPSPEPPPSSVIQSVAYPATHNTTDDEEEAAKYLALALAEDLVKQKDIVLVGGTPYAYNGKFYSLLRDDEAQRMFFANYRKEVARASTVTVLRSAATLLKL